MYPYVKPHFSLEKQAARLNKRGIHIAPERFLYAQEVLGRIGYIKFTSYARPFRRTNQAGFIIGEKFKPGVTFDMVLELYEFDRKLRILLLEALHIIELSLAVSIAYVLGEHDKYAHLNTTSLNESLCNLSPKGKSTAYQDWKSNYISARKKALSHPYMANFVAKHGDQEPVPIWIAIEFFDFGMLTGLVRLMNAKDVDKVRKHMNSNLSSNSAFMDWMGGMQSLRNYCAHGSRLFNNHYLETPDDINTKKVDPLIEHLTRIDRDEKRKLYFLAAFAGYLIKKIDPASDWGQRFALHCFDFRFDPYLSLVDYSGFPEGWEDNSLWE